MGLSGPALAVRFLLRHGHAAVAVFVVLSGYCLMLPVARDPEVVWPGPAFVLRAAGAAYPARVLCGVGPRPVAVRSDPAIRAVGRCPRPSRFLGAPVAAAGVLVSHVLLIHNLSMKWIFQLAPPFWTVATEGQIYLLFPVMVVLWRATAPS